MLGKCFDLSEFLLVDEDNPLRYQDAATSEHVLAWLKYKSNNSTDPDRSELVRGFLEYVQGVTMRPEPRKSSGDPSTYCQGDWMNSPWSIYRAGFELFVGRTLTLYDFDAEVSSDSERFFVEHSGYHHRPELAAFIREAGTLANFIAVPDGFNTARCRRTGDYWDLTMHKFLNPQEKGVTGSSEFRRMVDSPSIRMFLDAWMTEQGEPLPLFPDRFTKQYPNRFPGRPATKHEWLSTINEMTNRIQTRRREIQAYLDTLTDV